MITDLEADADITGERDDGRSLQEAVDAFQGSFVGEPVGTEFLLLYTSEYVGRRGGEGPDSHF